MREDARRAVLSAAAGEVRRRAERALEAARAHPRHLVLAALVTGLLGAPAPGPVAVASALLASVLAPNKRVAALAVAAVMVGMAWSGERTRALEHSELTDAVGEQLDGRVVALEPPKRNRGGGVSLRARWMSGDQRGEVGLLRLDPVKTATGEPAGSRPAASWAHIVPGSLLAVSARIEPLADWEAHQRHRGARAAIVVETWTPTGLRREGLTGVLDAARDRSRAALTAGIGEPQSALLRGMVLGEDAAVGDEAREAFRRSGLAHLLAVSGQNVMLLATLAMALATVAGASLRTRLAFALLLVVIYVPLAGGGPSIQRAGVMGAAGLVAGLAGRVGDRWYALLLAACITLAANPLTVHDVGWQLSFAAVIGLLAAAAPATRAFVRHGVPTAIAEVTAITAVATLATAPLLLVHFGELSVVSLAANLLAAPAVAPVMWLGMLAAGVAQLEPALALPLTWCNGHLVAYIEWVADGLAAIPYATVKPSAREGLAWLAIVAAVVAGVVVLQRRWRGMRAEGAGRSRLLPGAAAGVAVALVAAWFAHDGRGGGPPVAGDELLVSFLDVGQGDATLLQTSRATILFDTGPPEGPVLERLAEAGVRRLDALVVTHAQADHEGAATAVIARLRPRLVLNGGDGWPTAVQRALRAGPLPTGTRVIDAHAGQSISIDGIDLKTLWPPPTDRPDVNADPNETALVTHVRHGEFDLLLPADAESGVLRRLDLPQVEALKVSHHGSEDSGLPEVLDRLRPRVAAIEVGRGNSYGHPAPSTLAALRVVPQVARTDIDGTIRLRARARTMELER